LNKVVVIRVEKKILVFAFSRKFTKIADIFAKIFAAVLATVLAKRQNMLFDRIFYISENIFVAHFYFKK
jgi:hypothetical protein